MTNFEKYKDSLIKIEGDFAVDKNTGEIAGCNISSGVERRVDCEDCIFYEVSCDESDKIKWLYKEYKEPILSDDELELIKALGKLAGINYKYVIRDTCGIIRFFETKPHVNRSGNYEGEYTYADIAGDKFSFLPNITHEDGLYDIENRRWLND